MATETPIRGEPEPEFMPGFRLAWFEVFVLALGSAGAIILGSTNWQAGLLVAFVVIHFFLFCNVFRISRALELIWAAVFLTLSGGTIAWDVPGWMTTVAASLCLTVLVVMLEMGKPSYHGVWWNSINPGLRDWWQSYIRCRKDT